MKPVRVQFPLHYGSLEKVIRLRMLYAKPLVLEQMLIPLVPLLVELQKPFGGFQII